MSAPGVLAVMDGWIGRIAHTSGNKPNDLAEARAAVAELMAAVLAALDEMYAAEPTAEQFDAFQAVLSWLNTAIAACREQP